MRGKRHITRVVLAMPVAACVEGHDAMMLAQPACGLRPFSRVTREAVKQQARRPLPAEVEPGKTDTIALQHELRGHHRFLPPSECRSARRVSHKAPPDGAVGGGHRNLLDLAALSHSQGLHVPFVGHPPTPNPLCDTLREMRQRAPLRGKAHAGVAGSAASGFGVGSVDA